MHLILLLITILLNCDLTEYHGWPSLDVKFFIYPSPVRFNVFILDEPTNISVAHETIEFGYFNLSEKYNRVVLYEAAIAGGIPLIMPIKTILSGNKINKIQAILNGTTNYILTKMDTAGASYEDVLKEAQELGYAETDPTGDVEGFDAAYKITTLATISFNSRIKFENVYREGISKIRKEDMQKAALISISRACLYPVR